VFVAGFVRLGFPIVQQQHWLSKTFVAIFTLWLIWFISLYSLLHVVRPIVRLYHPNFTLPDIDENHIRPTSWIEAVFRLDFLVMLMVFSLTMYIGWFIIGAALVAVSNA